MLIYFIYVLPCHLPLPHPRWEDFEYKILDPARGRLYWLGNGQTYNRKVIQETVSSFRYPAVIRMGLSFSSCAHFRGVASHCAAPGSAGEYDDTLLSSQERPPFLVRCIPG
jgi:hypothetical protein